MIPVRIHADTTAHHVSSGRVVTEDHWLASQLCPVCDRPFTGKPVTLVYVGTDPADRDGRFWTGAAVAVHDSCAAPPSPDLEGTRRIRVLSWDVNQQPDPAALNEILTVLSRGGVHLREADTGSDEYALVFSTRPLADDEVAEAYRQHSEGGGA